MYSANPVIMERDRIMRKQKNLIKKQKAFTLVEVMIVVAILGILAVIALPSYQRHIINANRTDAQAKMLEIAGLLENNYTQRGEYNAAFITNMNADTNYNRHPEGVANNARRYIISIAAANSNQTYTITATPQTQGRQNTDSCQNLTLDNFYSKGQSGSGNCW